VLPKMDPKQMAKLMSQMGIKNEAVDAAKVTIEKSDGTSLVIDNPQVTKIDMQGQVSFQIAGSVRESKAKSEEKTDDAALVMEECGCTRQEAERALKEASGDLAEAILKLKG